ncbi:hypothetical protein L0Z65_02575 [Phaeobacter sp. BS52]|uniref:hypothetical protein n=1 Tax=Phaeobacter sp. BS52 TaxID=2907241 RepID=UPI003870D433
MSVIIANTPGAEALDNAFKGSKAAASGGLCLGVTGISHLHSRQVWQRNGGRKPQTLT